jgi:predicted alpha/beta-fold hydrolase
MRRRSGRCCASPPRRPTGASAGKPRTAISSTSTGWPCSAGSRCAAGGALPRPRGQLCQPLRRRPDARWRERGWGGAVPHFRGCSGEPNRLPRAYHSGDSAEIDWILRRLRDRFPQRSLFAAGVSLGGNALLKWAGEQEGGACDGAGPRRHLRAARPCRRRSGAAARLQPGLRQAFPRTLKAMPAAKLARFPGLFDAARMQAARNALRVRRHRHRAAARLPRRRRLLAPRQQQALARPGIRLPTLVLNALNDPFLPRQALPAPRQVAASVRLDYPEGGGHVGFVSADRSRAGWGGCRSGCWRISIPCGNPAVSRR